eukprot:c18325_g1_i1.p1 GENE.c18325_g1_i1~~c18325_g1_i1.p1  ORF type:complete len:147 (+),score=33.83 c18325_g1_i1:101-541(+)
MDQRNNYLTFKASLEPQPFLSEWAGITFQVYCHLQYVRGWVDVRVWSCPTLARYVLTGFDPENKLGGQQGENELAAVVCPLRTNEPLSFVAMEQIFSNAQSSVPNEVPKNEKWLTLAIVDGDSTLVFYRIANSLQQPHLNELLGDF